MNNYEQAKMMHEIIEKMVHKIFTAEKLLNLRIGKVISYDSTSQRAEVNLIGDDVAVTSSFSNKTGQNLVPDDIVYILIIDGSLTNSFIAWKKGLYEIYEGE